MKSIPDVGLQDVRAVYDGPEGKLWELIMGEQIHIGGLTSSMDLAERAEIAPGTTGVDLCCCTGAGMKYLVRFRDVIQMHGIDATESIVEIGRNRCVAEGLAEKVAFTVADACETGLLADQFDFVWGEDAWCYVVEKEKLIREAARLTRPAGTIAFTDWVEGPAGLTDDEAERFLRFMKFANIESIDGYRRLLVEYGSEVLVAEDTGRFGPCVDLYINMLEKQLTYDALKIIGFDMEMLGGMAGEMRFMQQLAHAGKIAQGIFIARKK